MARPQSVLCSEVLLYLRSPRGYTISMAEFTKFPTFFTSHQVNSNQVALRRLGTGNIAQNRGARAEDAQYGLRSKFTNDFIPVSSR